MELTNWKRLIGKANIKMEVGLINLRSGLTEENKFNIVISNCDAELRKLIFETRMETWKDIMEFVSDKKISADEIVEGCSTHRKRKENISTYISQTHTKLMSLGVSDKTVIKFLATTLWPHKIETAMILGLHNFIEEFIRHAVELDEKFKRFKEVKLCSKCKKPGHEEANCLKKI